MTGNPALIEKLRAEIAAHGPMPFRDFMAAALYDTEHGFYSSGRAQIGRRGDFFTSVSVGPLFGKLLARQFAEMWERLDRPAEFRIVEQGAGGGDFARDVFEAIEADFRAALRYTIVEPVEFLRERQREKLRHFPVTWVESLSALEPFCGVHFSNELIDAFPVHLVRFSGGEWRERCVGEKFGFVDLPPMSTELRARLPELPLPQIEDYETEINLDALAWIDDVGAKLTRGYVLTIDYGYPRDIFYAAERSRGTLACFSKHRRSDDPLAAIGETDLTAHVDFTSLAEHALHGGYEIAGFTDQHHFLIALAEQLFTAQAPDAKQVRAFQTLTHPQFLGTTFKVLALQKHVPRLPALTGFAYASAPEAALGLESPRALCE